MAEILFGTPDSGGDYPYSLASPRPDPANRFFDFRTDVMRVGPRRTTLGDAVQHTFAFRTDYVARLSVRHLAPSAESTMLALKLWLMDGGAVRVITRDGNAAVYTGLTLRPGTEPTIDLEDETRQHWKFSCELRHTSAITVDYSV